MNEKETNVRQYYNIKKLVYDQCKKTICKKYSISEDSLIEILYENLPINYYFDTFRKRKSRQIESEITHADTQKRILLEKEYKKTKTLHKTTRKVVPLSKNIQESITFSKEKSEEIIEEFKEKVLKEDLAKFIVQYDLDPLKRSISSLKLITMPKLWGLFITSFDNSSTKNVLLTEITNIINKTKLQKEKHKEKLKELKEKEKSKEEKDKQFIKQVEANLKVETIGEIHILDYSTNEKSNAYAKVIDYKKKNAFLVLEILNDKHKGKVVALRCYLLSGKCSTNYIHLKQEFKHKYANDELLVSIEDALTWNLREGKEFFIKRQRKQQKQKDIERLKTKLKEEDLSNIYKLLEIRRQ